MGTKDARRSVSASGAQVVRPWVPCGSTVAGLPVVSEATRSPVVMCRLWEGVVPR
jgi:hypothetical protein